MWIFVVYNVKNRNNTYFETVVLMFIQKILTNETTYDKTWWA